MLPVACLDPCPKLLRRRSSVSLQVWRLWALPWLAVLALSSHFSSFCFFPFCWFLYLVLDCLEELKSSVSFINLSFLLVALLFSSLLRWFWPVRDCVSLFKGIHRIVPHARYSYIGYIFFSLAFLAVVSLLSTGPANFFIFAVGHNVAQLITFMALSSSYLLLFLEAALLNE